MFKIRDCQLRAGSLAGEHMPLLVSAETGLPDLHATAYSVLNDRDAGKSPSTIERRLRGIGVGLAFLQQRGIDLVERLASGTFLANHELSGLAANCRNRADGGGQVVGEYSTNRYADFIAYIVHRSAIYRVRARGEQRLMLLKALEDFEKRAAAAKPQAKTSTRTKEREGLTLDQRRLFLEVIHPDHPKNPFREKLRNRNFALLLTSFRIGPRAGELLGLKREDYDDVGHSDDGSEARSLTIHRRPDDPDDKRRRQARQKTLARTIILHDPEVIRALGVTLKERKDRKLFPRAYRQPFLFVNEDGDALAYDGLVKIFHQIRRKFPELAALCNHMLRHDWNDRWEEMKAEKGWEGEQARMDQCYAQGWSPTSVQPDIYPKKAIRKRSSQRIADMAKKNIGLPRAAND